MSVLGSLFSCSSGISRKTPASFICQYVTPVSGFTSMRQLFPTWGLGHEDMRLGKMINGIEGRKAFFLCKIIFIFQAFYWANCLFGTLNIIQMKQS